jgi:hypothetical protein
MACFPSIIAQLPFLKNPISQNGREERNGRQMDLFKVTIYFFFV